MNGVGRFILSSSGSVNGSGFDGVEGSFIDPATITNEAEMASLEKCLFIETRNGRYYQWIATPTGATNPLTLDIVPSGDHSSRPAGNISNGPYCLSEINNGRAIVGAFTSRGITEAQKTELIKYNDTHGSGLSEVDVDASDAATQLSFNILMPSEYPTNASRVDVFVDMGDRSYSLDAWLSVYGPPVAGASLHVHNVSPLENSGSISVLDSKTSEVLTVDGIVLGQGHGVLSFVSDGSNWKTTY